jgi:hypothetical protein
MMIHKPDAKELEMQQVDIYSRVRTFEVVIGEQGSSRTNGSSSL